MLKITKNYILISLCLMVSLFFISCAGSSSSAKKTEVTADKKDDNKSGSKVECKVIEEYGDETIDAFTKGSYDLCSRVEKNTEQLREINDFLEDPTGYIAAEISKAKSEIKAKINAEISEAKSEIKAEISEAKSEIKKAERKIMEQLSEIEGIVENPVLGQAYMVGIMTQKLNDLMTNVSSDIEFAGSQIGVATGATSAATALKSFKKKISAAKSVKTALGNYKNAAVQMKDLAAEAKKALDNINNLVS